MHFQNDNEIHAYADSDGMTSTGAVLIDTLALAGHVQVYVLKNVVAYSTASTYFLRGNYRLIYRQGQIWVRGCTV